MESEPALPLIDDIIEDPPLDPSLDENPPDPNPGKDPPLSFDPDSDPPPDPDSDDEDPPASTSEENEAHITLEKMKLNSLFVEMARDATLESQFSPAELRAFQNPQELHFSPSEDPDLRLSIRFYLSSLDHHQSQRAYAEARMDV